MPENNDTKPLLLYTRERYFIIYRADTFVSTLITERWHRDDSPEDGRKKKRQIDGILQDVGDDRTGGKYPGPRSFEDGDSCG